METHEPVDLREQNRRRMDPEFTGCPACDGSGFITVDLGDGPKNWPCRECNRPETVEEAVRVANR